MEQASRIICTDFEMWKCGSVFAISYTKPRLAEQRARTNCHSQYCPHRSLVRMFVMRIVVITCIIVLAESTILTVMVITAAVISTTHAITIARQRLERVMMLMMPGMRKRS